MDHGSELIHPDSKSDGILPRKPDLANAGLTTYLARIAEYLIKKHTLRPHRNNRKEQVWRFRQFSPLEGTRRRGERKVLEYRLSHVKSFNYLDFQMRCLVRRYRCGRPPKEEFVDIAWHLSANADGSIRRIYTHLQGHEEAIKVRSLSLTNYGAIRDKPLAQLLMINEERLAWIRDLPVAYYPVTNKALRTISSLEEFVVHVAGPGAQIPKRLIQAQHMPEIVNLLQVVPVNHLNDIAATMKRHEAELRRQPTASRILLWYYRDAMPGETITGRTVYHYITGCRRLGQKINMRIRSANRLAEERAIIRRKRRFARLIDIRTCPELVLKRTDFGDVHLELIDTKDRLWQESQQMGSCVDSYCNSINEGRCAIYHVRYRNGEYTLEVRKDGAEQLYARQLLGVRNAEPPRKLRETVRAIFDELERSSTKRKRRTNVRKGKRKVA